MREIKFRAWYANQEMHYGIAPIDNNYYIFFETQKRNAHDLQINRAISIMQYTGLKDKNGKEIYEGDIVRAWSEGYSGVFKIEWRQDGVPCWMLYPSWKNDEFWYLHGVEHKGGQYHDTGIEVLGNVFENPELLKEESK